MALRFDDDIRNTLVASWGAVFDSGTLTIYTGTQPTTANDAATGTTLVTITLPADAFTAGTAGVQNKAGTWSASASAGGTAGWCRFSNSGDTQRMDGSVTATSGGGMIELDNTTIVSGGTVTISTFTLTQPAS